MDNGNGSSLAVCAHADLPNVFSGKAGVANEWSKSHVPELPDDDEELLDVYLKQETIIHSMSTCDARFNGDAVWPIIEQEKGHLQLQWHNTSKAGFVVLHCFRCKRKTGPLYFKGSYSDKPIVVRRISVDRII